MSAKIHSYFLDLDWSRYENPYPGGYKYWYPLGARYGYMGTNLDMDVIINITENDYLFLFKNWFIFKPTTFHNYKT